MSTKQVIIWVVVCVLVASILFVISQALIIRFNGRPVAPPTIPRDAQVLGSGPQLKYVVMGDSTTVAQGAAYDEGYALASARHLAQRYEVTLVNVGVSGAVARDVAEKQVKQAVKYVPDLVLIAVGANDVTHLTSSSSVEHSMKTTFERLRAVNPDVRIVVTGVPAMDTIDRFPWAVQRVAFRRVSTLNTVFERLSQSYNVVRAPIADQTRDAFKRDPTLFAADKFHPNARGYALWIPIIDKALDEALAQRP